MRSSTRERDEMTRGPICIYTALEFMKNSWKPSGAILGIMLPLLSISYYCQGGHPTSLVLSELAFQGCFPEGWGFRLRPTEMLTAASCLQVGK
ncbi:hypothetical protein V1478_003124 [Vespula squamosa]|uniref:Uncharacterized protein n=1 Tax=Vespula squamosa TaxID=30214 RepID=A0ABD2BRS8_VESSQ